MRRFLGLGLLLGAAIAFARDADAQADGVRAVRAWTEPQSIPFGEPALVHVELRAGPGLVVFLPDTLVAGRHVTSLGTVRWTTAPAAGDSLGIAAEYPVIGYRKGIQELPQLELSVGRGADPARPAQVLRASDAAAADGLLTASLPLGSTTVAEYLPVDEPDSSSVLVPRPPADVIGGDWSPWMVLLVGLATVAGVGGAGALLPRWWGDRGAALLARLRGHSPKQEALRELDRLRSQGLHTNGRVDEFYASTTDVLRGYVTRIDPLWTPALTTSELLGRLEERLGTTRVDRLAGALTTAELTKFAMLRPDASAAEADWAVIRAWLKDAPEP